MKTVLISAVLFMVFVGRHLISEKYKGKLHFDTLNGRAMIDRAIDVLDGRFKKPFPPFETPAQVLDILSRDPDSEYAMNIFLQNVAAHCGYDRRALMLRVYPAQEGKPPGQIQKLGSQFLMELYMKNEGNIRGTLAVIIHEFCHFYLDESGIKLENTVENEVLTDTAAIYFGFGSQLREGYTPTVAHSMANKGKLVRIGYLDTLNIDYVQNKLNRRSEFYDTVPKT